MSALLPPTVIRSTLTTGQGPAGPAGAPGGSGTEYPAAVAISGHACVALDASGQVVYASANNPAHALAFVGVSQGAAAAGAQLPVLRVGAIDFGGWSWTPGAHVFLGNNGALSLSMPADAAFCLVVGIAISPTRLLISAQPPINVI